MTTLDTTNFGIAVAAAGGQTQNLYGVGVRQGEGSGLRQFYEWGLWSRQCTVTWYLKADIGN